MLQFLKLCFHLWILLERVCLLDMILMLCNMHGEGFFWFWIRGLGAVFYEMLVWCLGMLQSSTFLFFCKVHLIICVIQCTCSMVECFCQNPNWWSRRIWFSSSIEHNPLSTAFSKNFLIILSRLIGLYQLACSSSLPGCRIIMICSTFHWTGKYLF
jgi:hypothetical protein